VLASTPDLLRLVAIPVLGWAAWRDIETRRVPNRTWYPLAGLAIVLLLWEGFGALTGGDQFFIVQAGISLGFIIPLTTAFWYMGSFGGADAKAFYVIALLFPAYPIYYLPGLALPLEPTPVRVFSLTILSNTVLAGVAYPVAIAGRNALSGAFGWAMLVGKQVAWEDLPHEYGMLLETPSGLSRAALDLDALRMYLQWRGVSLADLRADPDQFRDPASVPTDPNPVGDGGLESSEGSPPLVGPTGAAERADAATGERPESVTADDEWGADAFLDDIEGSAYGTTPEKLRDGLEVLTAAETVWISPGIPFLVPMFFGLLISFTYGDVLFALMAAVGFV
jgi:preflagellin peptidase FlaK